MDQWHSMHLQAVGQHCECHQGRRPGAQAKWCWNDLQPDHEANHRSQGIGKDEPMVPSHFKLHFAVQLCYSPPGEECRASPAACTSSRCSKQQMQQQMVYDNAAGGGVCQQLFFSCTCNSGKSGGAPGAVAAATESYACMDTCRGPLLLCAWLWTTCRGFLLNLQPMHWLSFAQVKSGKQLL